MTSGRNLQGTTPLSTCCASLHRQDANGTCDKSHLKREFTREKPGPRTGTTPLPTICGSLHNRNRHAQSWTRDKGLSMGEMTRKKPGTTAANHYPQFAQASSVEMHPDMTCHESHFMREYTRKNAGDQAEENFIRTIWCDPAAIRVICNWL